MKVKDLITKLQTWDGDTKVDFFVKHPDSDKPWEKLFFRNLDTLEGSNCVDFFLSPQPFINEYIQVLMVWDENKEELYELQIHGLTPAIVRDNSMVLGYL